VTGTGFAIFAGAPKTTTQVLHSASDAFAPLYPGGSEPGRAGSPGGRGSAGAARLYWDAGVTAELGRTGSEVVSGRSSGWEAAGPGATGLCSKAGAAGRGTGSVGTASCACSSARAVSGTACRPSGAGASSRRSCVDARGGEPGTAGAFDSAARGACSVVANTPSPHVPQASTNVARTPQPAAESFRRVGGAERFISRVALLTTPPKNATSVGLTLLGNAIQNLRQQCDEPVAPATGRSGQCFPWSICQTRNSRKSVSRSDGSGDEPFGLSSWGDFCSISCGGIGSGAFALERMRFAGEPCRDGPG
jgi:hypothetical protein